MPNVDDEVLQIVRQKKEGGATESVEHGLHSSFEDVGEEHNQNLWESRCRTVG